MDQQQAIEVIASLGLDPERARHTRVSGGSIARAYRLELESRRLLVKCMDTDQAAVLEAEKAGLEALAASRTVRVPEVAGIGRADGVAWLAIEWLDLLPLTADVAARLGAELVELHQRSAACFGFACDNFIGHTPQPNPECLSWTEFFLEHRLGYQLDLLDAANPQARWAAKKQALGEAWQRIAGDYQPPVSLIHGDFWGGNAAMLADGTPVVFDPAVHYADRECDLAMADLFGGFPADFFAAYRGIWPLSPGWRERRRFYQLYHLLNHANLFGGHYLSISRRLIEDLCG